MKDENGKEQNVLLRALQPKLDAEGKMIDLKNKIIQSLLDHYGIKNIPVEIQKMIEKNNSIKIPKVDLAKLHKEIDIDFKKRVKRLNKKKG